MNLQKADKYFSTYIRRREADELGFVKCCTCPTVLHWSQMDCGHYYRRGNLTVRWDEMNAHTQCQICNRMLDGNKVIYIQFMKSRYSSSQLIELDSKANETADLIQYEIDEIAEKIKQKIKEL